MPLSGCSDSNRRLWKRRSAVHSRPGIRPAVYWVVPIKGSGELLPWLRPRLHALAPVRRWRGAYLGLVQPYSTPFHQHLLGAIDGLPWRMPWDASSKPKGV